MSGRSRRVRGKRLRTESSQSQEDPTEQEDMASTLSSSEGTTAQEVVEKARKRARALHPAAVHLQRSVDALSNLVGNLKEEQTRQRWIGKDRRSMN